MIRGDKQLEISFASPTGLDFANYENRFIDIPVDYMASYRDYKVEYLRGLGCKVEDRSFFVSVNGVVEGFMPLLLVDSSKFLGLESDRPTSLALGPLFSGTLSEGGRAEATRASVLFLRSMKSNGLSDRLILGHEFGDVDLPTLLKNDGVSLDGIVANLEIDLLPGSDALFRSFRKSHQKQIRRHLDKLNVEITTRDSVLDELRALHLAVSGRVTRPLPTWKCQAIAMQRGEAFIVTTRDELKQLIGALYVMHSKTSAVSFSAAYRRDLMQAGLPLGHVCEWKAIQHLADNTTVASYQIGKLSRRQNSTAKLQNISYFKDGFAPKYMLEAQLEIL